MDVVLSIVPADRLDDDIFNDVSDHRQLILTKTFEDVWRTSGH
jgi:hypothetical protein